MILLSVRDVSRQFDAEPVFSRVTFDVRPGERIGLVGPNGTGKTTLLNVLAGLDSPDVGTVEKANTAEVALLEQQLDLSHGRTLVEEAKQGLAALYALQYEAEKLAHEMAAEKDAEKQDRLHKRYDHIQHELHRHDAYHLEHRVDEVLHGLGFSPEDYDRPLTQFSGGQQNRVILARMLLHAPDVMLLDEPTNHLDIAATEWLEEFLAKSNQSIILVSHDRYFLDRVTNRTLELFGGKVSDYKGNFSAYWRQREERSLVAQRTYEKQQEFIARTEDFIRRNKYGQKHAQAADRVKKLERLDRVELQDGFQELAMNFGEASRTGDWVIDAAEVANGFDELLFKDVNLRILRGERVGILGPNGSGKTTLLRTLIGELPPRAGKVRFGTGVNVGYYDQQLSGVDPSVDAVDAVRPPGDLSFTPNKARDLLARFGVRGDLALQKVGAMSGGEKSRVALARIAALNANVLILDEPTNHLDLWARSSLEETLKGFNGTLLFVSHDRYFLDRVATSVVVLQDGNWKYYEGNYSDYLHFVHNQRSEAATQPVEKVTAKADAQTSASTDSVSSPNNRKQEKQPKRRRKFPYRKVHDIEADIAEKEELLESLQADLADPEVLRDGDRVRDTMEAFEATQQEIDELYEHWEEATELN